MKAVLADIQDGTFAGKWIAENKNGRTFFNSKRAQLKKHQMEIVGEELRRKHDLGRRPGPGYRLQLKNTPQTGLRNPPEPCFYGTFPMRFRPKGKGGTDYEAAYHAGPGAGRRPHPGGLRPGYGGPSRPRPRPHPLQQKAPPRQHPAPQKGNTTGGLPSLLRDVSPTGLTLTCTQSGGSPYRRAADRKLLQPGGSGGRKLDCARTAPPGVRRGMGPQRPGPSPWRTPSSGRWTGTGSK